MPSVLSYANAFPMDNVLARKFDGATDFINCGTNSALQISNAASFTVGAWVYLTRFINPMFIVARDDNSLGRNFAFGFFSQQLYCEIAGTACFSGAAGPILTGNWHHVAITFVPGASIPLATGYVDGVSINSGTASNPPGASTGAFTIGQRTYSGANGFFGGSAVDVAFWNVALTPTQIVSLAAGTRASAIGSPLLVLPITGASPEPDKSGNSNNGVLNGSALPFAPLSLGGPATLGLI